jgi:hypothetical protein
MGRAAELKATERTNGDRWRGRVAVTCRRPTGSGTSLWWWKTARDGAERWRPAPVGAPGGAGRCAREEDARPEALQQEVAETSTNQGAWRRPRRKKEATSSSRGERPGEEVDAAKQFLAASTRGGAGFEQGEGRHGGAGARGRGERGEKRLGAGSGQIGGRDLIAFRK